MVDVNCQSDRQTDRQTDRQAHVCVFSSSRFWLAWQRSSMRNSIRRERSLWSRDRDIPLRRRVCCSARGNATLSAWLPCRKWVYFWRYSFFFLLSVTCFNKAEWLFNKVTFISIYRFGINRLCWPTSWVWLMLPSVFFHSIIRSIDWLIDWFSIPFYLVCSVALFGFFLPLNNL